MSAEGESGRDQARMAVKEMSKQDIDALVKASSFSQDVEQAILNHIHLELTNWYFFKKLAADCARSDICLHGFAMLWSRSATECFADAHWLEKYLVQRGGTSSPKDIPAPNVEWPDEPIEPISPVRAALEAEKRIFENLHKLCATADQAGDYALEDAIETRFLKKESKHVKDLGDLLQQVVRVSKQAGHGLYHLDRELRKTNGRIPWGHANVPDSVDAIISDEASSLS